MVLESRRNFIKTSFLSTLVMVMSQGKLFGAVTPLQTLVIVQKDLFPQEMITASNAFAYIGLIFKHSRVSAEDKQYLRNGTKWLNEEAVSMYGEVYTKLTSKQRQSVLEKVTQEPWGESWVKIVLSYILEATLGDPIYGINKNESGWKWLEHESGLPHPKEMYL